MDLANKDYEIILRHYNIAIPRKAGRKKDFRKIKKRAHDILINKLCRCIKAVQKTRKKIYTKRAAIAICNKSIFGNRGLKHFRFTCKKKKRLLTKKGRRKKLAKTKKIYFRPKRN